jgi:hypothetical protein
MTPSGNLPRRLFLQMLLSLHVFVLSRPAHSYARKDEVKPFDPLPSKLASFFHHNQSAKKVGLEYLKMAPSEADISLLSNLICACDEHYRAKLLRADSSKCRELLRQRISVDFEQDCVVNVQGWILAVTESRLCALTALL